jgi:cellulose biosynthesis protein BcsQ
MMRAASSTTPAARVASSYDVVVDGPPKLGDMTRSAPVAADVVLVPVQPGPFDAWGTAETLPIQVHARVKVGAAERRQAIRQYILTLHEKDGIDARA